MSLLHDRELHDLLFSEARRRGQDSREIARAKRAQPARFARVRAVCVGAGYVNLDAHAARIVNTVNRLEAR